MSRIFALIALLAALVFAKEPNFDPSSVHTFELKKDEWARVFITEKKTQRVETFDFRWTLFDSTNITVQSFFRRYPRQMVFSLRQGQNTYMQRVLPDFMMPPNESVSLYISFIDFKDKKAHFRVALLDESKRVDVGFRDPHEDK
ncbi:hypothetical protein [Campylobacter concisus]|uniref:hypothetical protein n=1 Tax=Campylobacter concisus TaxID=199 RepID=UPI000CD90473|nr:hypothetical protein [Campylobacter concisus]QPH93600.1 hypothetical protein CVT07_03925 [Campylobacter concisus]